MNYKILIHIYNLFFYNIQKFILQIFTNYFNNTVIIESII